jgi:hypothetical protein
MIILVVGPSGVGKSDACDLLKALEPGCLFYSLDAIAARWAHRHGWIAEVSIRTLANWCKNADHLLAIGLQAMSDAAAASDGQHLVVDVGAGFQATFATRLSAMYQTITIMATPEVAYQRWRTRPVHATPQAWNQRQYTVVEFSPYRREVYGRSKRTIDVTTLTSSQTAETLRQLLVEMLTR